MKKYIYNKVDSPGREDDNGDILVSMWIFKNYINYKFDFVFSGSHSFCIEMEIYWYY